MDIYGSYGVYRTNCVFVCLIKNTDVFSSDTQIQSQSAPIHTALIQCPHKAQCRLLTICDSKLINHAGSTLVTIELRCLCLHGLTKAYYIEYTGHCKLFFMDLLMPVNEIIKGFCNVTGHNFLKCVECRASASIQDNELRCMDWSEPLTHLYASRGHGCPIGAYRCGKMCDTLHTRFISCVVVDDR